MLEQAPTPPADGQAQQDAPTLPSPDKLAHLLTSIGWQPVHDMQHENLRDVMPTISAMFRRAQQEPAQ